MNINTKALVSITEANQNFSRVARLVDEHGAAVILKNNRPRYLLIDFGRAEQIETAVDEDVTAISKRLIEQNREAYKTLIRAEKIPITFDEDCPETTPEQGVKFKRVNPPHRDCKSSQT